MRLLPTTRPSASTTEPSALSFSPGIWATAQTRSGYTSPSRTVSSSSARSAAQCWRMMLVIFMSGHPGEELDYQVDEFDTDERRDDAAEAVHQEVAAQQLRRAGRGVANTFERQRDQEHDDDRVEDHRGQDCRLRTVQAH